MGQSNKESPIQKDQGTGTESLQLEKVPNDTEMSREDSICTGVLSSISTLRGLLDAAPTAPLPRKEVNRGPNLSRGRGLENRSNVEERRNMWKRRMSDSEFKTFTSFHSNSRAHQTSLDHKKYLEKKNISSPLTNQQNDSVGPNSYNVAHMPKEKKLDGFEKSPISSSPSCWTENHRVEDRIISGISSNNALNRVPVRLPPKNDSSDRVVTSNSQGISSVSSYKLWKPKKITDPREIVRREMKGLLNKLTVENFPIVGEKICVICEKCASIEDLYELVEILLDKAFDEPEFSELYADLCLIIGYRTTDVLRKGERKIIGLISGEGSTNSSSVTFASLLMTKWKAEFDKVPNDQDLFNCLEVKSLSPEDREIKVQRIKGRVKGLCTTFGEFLVRRIIHIRGFDVATTNLLSGENPGEHFVEGICQMLTTAGFFLDSDDVGSLLVDHCFGRLQELKSQGRVSKRIMCLIQDLLDARSVKWHKKIYKEKAKELSTIKKEVENAELIGGSVVSAQFGTVVQLGRRFNLIDNVSYCKYVNEQEEKFRKLNQK